MNDGGGKYDAFGPVIRTNEVQNPLDMLALRMRALGATEELIDHAKDNHGRGRLDLIHMDDESLALLIGASLSGSDTAFDRADLTTIATARTDRETWLQAAEKVQGTIPTVIAWVGKDAGRAYVAHEAELDRANDAGVEPRRSLIKFLSLVHGQTAVGVPT